jgi:hypothetical protein
MYKTKLRLLFISTIIFYLLINCSTPHTDEEEKDTEVVDDIMINEVSNKVPVENSEQIDLELLAILSDENSKSKVDYTWYVEYLKLDIENSSSTSTNIDYSEDNDLLISKYLEGYYFLESSKKNPSNALLSIYKDGFYKVTLKTSNNNNKEEYSVVIKVGEPVLPNLFVKVNIPKMNKLSKNSYVGEFYLKKIPEDQLNNSSFYELNAQEMMDDWYDTGIIINPFEPFKIIAGTHILNNSSQNISSVINNKDLSDYDSIVYSFNSDEIKNISLCPLIVKGNNYNKILINKTGSASWLMGNLYISFLMWKDDNTEYDKFIYLKREINQHNTKISVNLNGTYLTKVFIGSFGHKIPFNNYYIYFGPEGSNLDELDPRNKREYPGLPYGFLLGKLGEDGTVFPISNQFNYETKQILKVLSF